METDRNSQVNVLLWAHKCLKTTDITETYKHILLRIAKASIAKGGLRGDVSEQWKAFGFGPDVIDDMYL